MIKKQNGQSAVELAIVLPLFFTLVFAVLYAGIMFMDYIQFSNAARAAARDISLAPIDTSVEDNKATIIEKLNEQDKDYINRYANPLTSLYKATFDVEPKQIKDTDHDVTVTVSFVRNDDNFPLLLNKVNFPPKSLGSITYIMPLENKTTSEG